MRKTKRERRDANAGDAIPGLLNDIVVTHVLRSEHFDDPADLARLPAVSRAMRDAVAAMGLRFREFPEYEAAALGCLSALQRLHRGGRLYYQEHLGWAAAAYPCQGAARGGHLEVLQWLHANGCPLGANTCMYAARGGHLEVLQWLCANGCPWGGSTCEEAAEGGHLWVLQWARANGCPWDKLTCARAAERGHLVMLQWLRANGCPWDGYTCRGAAQGGHLEVLQCGHVPERGV